MGYKLYKYNEFIDYSTINESNINTLNENMFTGFLKNIIGGIKGGLQSALKDPKNKDLLDTFLKNIGATTFGEKYMRGAAKHFMKEDMSKYTDELEKVLNDITTYKNIIEKYKIPPKASKMIKDMKEDTIKKLENFEESINSIIKDMK